MGEMGAKNRLKLQKLILLNYLLHEEFSPMPSVLKHSLNAVSAITLKCLLGSPTFSAISLEVFYITIADHLGSEV